MSGVERKEEGTERLSLGDTTDKRSLRWRRMSPKNLLGSTRQIRGEPIQDSTIQTFWVKSVEEQGIIDSVERGAKIQQNKESIVSPIDQCQQLILVCEEGRSQCYDHIYMPIETWHANCLCLDVSATDRKLLSIGSWTRMAGSTPGGSYWGLQGPGLTSWLTV